MPRPQIVSRHAKSQILSPAIGSPLVMSLVKMICGVVMVLMALVVAIADLAVVTVIKDKVDFAVTGGLSCPFTPLSRYDSSRSHRSSFGITKYEIMTTHR